MAFVSCEFSNDLEGALTFDRILNCALVTKCLVGEGSESIQSLLDENFLVSFVHLVLKTWIKGEPEERKTIQARLLLRNSLLERSVWIL